MPVNAPIWPSLTRAERKKGLGEDFAERICNDLESALYALKFVSMYLHIQRHFLSKATCVIMAKGVETIAHPWVLQISLL